MSGILGKKLGMTQIYTEDGKLTPVTAIAAGPCVVMQIKSKEKDGYDAIQLGFEERRRKVCAKPQQGHAKKANTEPRGFVRELPPVEGTEYQLGQEVTVEVLEGIRKVDVRGVSKGKGFAGAVKRWGFRGGRASHGGSSVLRRRGSIGQSAYPARTFKGLKMPGHMGMRNTTVKNLEVVRIDKENNIVLVRGAVPGAAGGYLIVSKSKTALLKDDSSKGADSEDS